jgi:hypothetical protein
VLFRLNCWRRKFSPSRQQRRVADAAEAEAKSALNRMPLNIPEIRPSDGTNKLATKRQQMEVIQ